MTSVINGMYSCRFCAYVNTTFNKKNNDELRCFLSRQNETMLANLLISDGSVYELDPLVSNIITLQVYVPSSPSIR